MRSGAQVRILRAAGRTAAVWKNGGGVTREIAAFPDGAGMDDFLWRASLAEVAADGPFSAFPGIDRTLTLAEGAGMDLVVGGERRLVDERFAPQDFPGDEPTDCRLLSGPVVNFNVMYRRGAVKAETAVVRGRLSRAVVTDETLLVAALEGGATVRVGRAPDLSLERYDAVLVMGDFLDYMDISGHAALVCFR
ncbi:MULTISPECIES: HutD family protein [unclassified Streptomyces]|uniref:HutD/Ves family protein n=1 Tax=unclassified Streptomyces TaxID=2593676 RepID=UPI003651D3EF